MDEGVGDRIRPAEVEQAVRAQLGDATVLAWQVRHVGRGRGDNVTSLGVQRVQGRARTPGGEVRWTQVRKRFVRPGGAEDAEDDWNHWRREPLLLGSGWLRELPPDVAAPAVYLVVDDVDTATVWMEDAGDAPPHGWHPEQLGTVAHRLGQLAGWFLDRSPTAPWLGRDLLGQWIARLPSYAPQLYHLDAPGWRDPRIRAIYEHGRDGAVAALLDTAATAWAGLDGTSSTLCHRDCGTDNLRLRRGSAQLVLFDWALAGPGPVGEDLGLLLTSVARLSAGADPLVAGRHLLVAYLDGVTTTGSHDVDAATVWRVAVSTAALREAIFAAAKLSTAITTDEPDPDGFATFADDAPALELLAAEALRLAGSRGASE
jgi:hypothetical protein